ncbi:MAG: 3-deoxy-D-manno-octulosonic acid transferase [Robiginitomaculum sp.]|nr:MAG: 3-deoxy-D-manno-octulosonic acid transferase [Robiginitomaculum sp.]
MMPLGLVLYRGLTYALSPFAPRWLGRRAKRGKEEASRLGERFGFTDIPRPQGTLIWLHGASVGEAAMALNLIKALRAARPEASFLLTTGTRTSAELVARQGGKAVIHQYLPLDIPGAVQRFLTHWQPDLGLMLESELWPNLILDARARGVKLALVNARMNAHSLRRWQNVPFSAARLLNAFDWIGSADESTRMGLLRLTNKRHANIGNLKLSAPAPKADKTALKHLKDAFADRPVWLGLSTHEGEEKVLLAAHKSICEQHHNALLVLVPRHPERANNVARLCIRMGLPPVRHSEGTILNKTMRVYLGDSIGDMGLWLRLGAPAFIGGSLISTLTGHNPLEAAQINVPILCGPYRDSFFELYDQLVKAKAAVQAQTAPAIAKTVLDLWQSPERIQTMGAAGAGVAKSAAHIPMEETLSGLLPLIEKGQDDARA